MRHYRIIYSLLIGAALFSCKKGIVKSGTPESYSEDLSVHRPILADTTGIDGEESSQIAEVPGNTENIYSIKEEMDQVNQMITIRNSQKQFIDGYTIQVYTGNDAEAANEAKEYVEEMFPDLVPVVAYHQPTFKVKVGSYHNRLEAHKVFESLKKDFPLAILIPERIKVAYE